MTDQEDVYKTVCLDFFFKSMDSKRKKIDITQYYDSIDFGVPYIDNWKEFEQKRADDYISDMLLKGEEDIE